MKKPEAMIPEANIPKSAPKKPEMIGLSIKAE